MHPVLIRIGTFEIHTYGLLVAIGFLAGIAVAGHNAKREGIDPQRLSDLGLWLIVAGMLGGKIFHIIFLWPEFIAGWRADGIASLRQGFVFYGGFTFAVAATLLYTRWKRLPFWKVTDACAPGVALGHAFGRLGCFFEGCCFGKACAAPWAVKFPSPHVMAGIPVHPTQLYEATGNLVIFGVLMAFYRRKRFDGQILWWYVFLYAVLRFKVEFFRGDYETHYGGVWTLGHLIALVMATLAVVMLVRHHGQGKTT